MIWHNTTERRQTADAATPTETHFNPRVSGGLSTACAALLLLAASSAYGQASPAIATSISARPASTKSAQRVARLTFTIGDVRVDGASDAAANAQTTAQTAAQTAVQNMPLGEGSVISTADDGQAELEFEDGSIARLTPNTAISLLNLSIDANGVAQSRLAVLHGLAYFELRSTTQSQYSIDAQGDLISPIENSTLRVNLDEPPAIVAVLDGMVHVDYRGGGQTSALADVSAGQTLRSDPIPSATGNGRFLVKQEIDPESWDQWNEARDQAASAEASNQTAARGGFAGNQGYGWSDLDANGSWYNVPGQGEVWQPDVAANPDASASPDNSAAFDPYDFGNWVWQSGPGYVWASGYSWGWTPYHCGTWNYWDGFGWGWSPGLYCSAYGFGGYGYGVNLGHIPRLHPRPIRPTPRPGLHPLVRVHGGVAPVSPGGHVPGSSARVIAGRLAQPLPAIGGGSTPRGGTALGGALVRDYPVDHNSRQPILGVASNHEAFPSAYTGSRSTAWRPVGTASSQMRPVTPAARSVYVVPQGYAAQSPSGNRGDRGDRGTRGDVGTVGDRGGASQPNGVPALSPEQWQELQMRRQQQQQQEQQQQQQSHPAAASHPSSTSAAPAASHSAPASAPAASSAASSSKTH